MEGVTPKRFRIKIIWKGLEYNNWSKYVGIVPLVTNVGGMCCNSCVIGF